MHFKQEPVKLEIGGVMRELYYDLNAYSEIETRYGSIDKALSDLSKGSLKALRLLLWAGMLHSCTTFDEFTGEPVAYGINIGQVGSWVSIGEVKEVSEYIGKALSDGIPEETLASKNELTT